VIELMMGLSTALLCAAVIALSIKCYLLNRALTKAQKDYKESDRLFRTTFSEMLKSNMNALKMRIERDAWLKRWKAGAFEMDAATMASLAEQEWEP
jgi:hypothetical protein